MAAELVGGRVLLIATALAAAAGAGILVPPRTGPSLSGLAVGAGLFILLACGRPRLPSRPVVPLLARETYLIGGAAFEELLWRGLGLGIVARVLGPIAGLALTSVVFAACHRRTLGRRRAVHIATGLGFGAAYFAGGLVAAILAHATYNVLVDLAVQAEREAAA